MAPGLAVIVRIPAVQEGEEKLVSPDLQSLGRRRHLRTADGVLSVLFLIFLETQEAQGRVKFSFMESGVREVEADQVE